ncbi:MAG: SDR family oxidoreductase [Persicimonas sp.]
MRDAKTVLVTGAAGFIGTRLLEALSDGDRRLIATDIKPLPGHLADEEAITYREIDIRDEEAVVGLFEEFEPSVAVHLAAMVTPPPGAGRKLQFDVDVRGTRHVIKGCLAAGVEQFIYTSSGAAYGYHADNPVPLCEDDELRGNREFAYADHKRLVEEELAVVRRQHPELNQLVFRVSTVLGPETDNQITALFEQPVVTGIRGADSPFCIISDRDVVGAIVHGLETGQGGVYNLTGDGVLSLEEIAERMGGRYVALPEAVVRAALFGLSRVGATPYGPEQVLFLKHRPVLDNTALVEEFGYEPTDTSAEAFERYRRARREDAPGRTVLITGAGGGLGCALAREHVERGDDVVLFDTDPVGLERTYMMARAHGGEAVCLRGDVTSQADCMRAVETAVEAFGGIDLLYNNAGIPQRGFFDETDADKVARVLEVNLMGAVRMTEAALPYLRRRRGGVVAISSVAGFAPLTGRTAYAASKHGLHGFFESLRTEVAGEGVSVTMVCPAYLATRFRREASDGAEELDVDRAAETIVDGVLEERRLILVGRTAHLAWWMRRLAPGLFEQLMRRSVREEFPT